MTDTFELCTVGTVRSCFGERFGTPRQPGLVPSSTAELRLRPPFDVPETLSGLDGFSHVWITYWFHENAHTRWTPTVRPPRLGGNRRMGVFATRSPYRPNPVGLSVAEVVGVVTGPEWCGLELRNHDLVDGTPVIDIKPYLPYADRLAEAHAADGFQRPRERLSVLFDPELEGRHPLSEPTWRALVEETLAADPRPAYRHTERNSREYGVRLGGYNVRFRVRDDEAEVFAITAE